MPKAEVTCKEFNVTTTSPTNDSVPNANVEEAPPGGYDNTTLPSNTQGNVGETVDNTDQLGPLYQREIKKKRYSPL